MKPFPTTPQTLLVASRIIWFEPPGTGACQSDPLHGLRNDLRKTRRYAGDSHTGYRLKIGQDPSTDSSVFSSHPQAQTDSNVAL
jgi:hypothetical protein